MNDKQKELARTTTDPRVLDELAKGYGRGVQEFVAKNSYASPNTLKWIAENQKWNSVIFAVADNDNTSIETLQYLINTKAKPPSGAQMFFGDPSINAIQARDAQELLRRATLSLSKRAPKVSEKDPVAILKEKFARGEISEEEFVHKKQLLES